jgi:glycosyltransferase involved in cell wall biosynthesis
VTSATPIDHSRKPARALRVTIIAANPFLYDSRFLRSAQSLAEDGHTVTVLAWAGQGLPAEEALGERIRLVRLSVPMRISDALRPPLPGGLRDLVCRLIGLDPAASVLPPDQPRGLDRLRHPVRRLLEVAANLRRVKPWTGMVLRAAPGTDVFHCQSLVALPVAHEAARRSGARFVYDVADYHAGAERIARMPRVVRELVRRRERRLARDAAGFLAVSDPVADLVARGWDVSRPSLLLNCPPAWRPDEPGPPVSDLLRAAAGTEPGRSIVLFQGGFSIDRGLEELVAALDEPQLRKHDLVLVFMGYGRLQSWLEGAALADPSRIKVLLAVSPNELLEYTAGATLSYVGQPPRTLNHRMNLPNKLFESLMAGVPVIVAEGNEQCRLVRAEGVGLCADIDRPAAIATAIDELLSQPEPERLALRAQCRTVALTRYTWDANAGGLIDLYRRLAADTSQRAR